MPYLSTKAWSDAARESAMRVRRGGTALGSQAPASNGMTPAIAARVKEILAEKASKGKKKKAAGHKGKSGADKQKKAAAALAKKKEAAAAREKAKVARDMERAGKQAARAAATKQKQAARETAKAERTATQKAKQAERTKAKAERLVAHRKKQASRHKKLTQAQQKKDAKDTVAAAIANIRAGKAMTDLAIKAGARHSANDMKHIQAAHDSTVMAGAMCAPGDGADEADTEDAAKAIKGIMDDPGYYAQHECGDVMQACNGLSTLCLLIQSELAEEDEDTTQVMNLCDAADTLVEFIQGELDELRGAAKDDASEDATIGHEPMKAITEREDVNPKEGVSKYGSVAFADAKNKKYPIDTEEHVRSAWNYINKSDNAAKYAADEVSQIKAKIVAAWKRLIDKAGPPSAGKAWDFVHIDGGAIKAIGDDDEIGGYAVLFGDAANHDIERDFYTKATDFWLDHFGWPRPITYHHGMDAGTRDNPVIGHWTKAAVDDTGVWLTGQLDRAHAYYKAIKELAARGYLKLSSDSAPQWVQRERQTNGANYVKRWPLVTASTTVTPMEPRMLPVEVKAFLAELGLNDIDDNQEAVDPELARSDETKASDDERARALLLELDLLELETTE